MAATTGGQRRGGHEGKIDVNSAGPNELQKLDGIDDEQARLIVKWRSEHGSFGSWDELVAVPGIGDVRLEKVQQQATIGGETETKKSAQRRAKGGAEARKPSPAAEIQEPDEEETIEEEARAEEIEEVDDLEDALDLDALVAIARLDHESAIAYRIAAEHVDDDRIRDALMTYGGDHERHLEELGSFIQKVSGQPLPKNLDASEDAAEAGLLPALMEATAPEGTRAILTALIADEHLTNASYEVALSVAADDVGLLEIVEQGREDERRHLASLLELERGLASGEAAETGA